MGSKNKAIEWRRDTLYPFKRRLANADPKREDLLRISWEGCELDTEGESPSRVELFAERYEIVRLLGEGGMGKVSLARDRMLNNELVALKVLHRDLSSDEKHTKRFLREVQLTRRVTHLNVVRTFDVGSYDGQLFFTMEYIEGDSLKDKLAAEGGTIESYEAARILMEICKGLAAIHEGGIVHRDLKPGNVVICKDGSIKIADFGIARPGSSDITGHNEMVGSIAYIAPEIWKGQDVDLLTDLYALGVMAYEITTGVLPFDGESPAELMCKHLEGNPLHPTTHNKTIPLWLESLILKLLAPIPAHRPRSAQEVAAMIEQKLKRRDATMAFKVDRPLTDGPADLGEAGAYVNSVMSAIEAPQVLEAADENAQKSEVRPTPMGQRLSSAILATLAEEHVPRATTSAITRKVTVSKAPLKRSRNFQRALRATVTSAMVTAIAALLYWPLSRMTVQSWNGYVITDDLVARVVTLLSPVALAALLLSTPTGLFAVLRAGPLANLGRWFRHALGLSVIWALFFFGFSVWLSVGSMGVNGAIGASHDARDVVRVTLTNLVEAGLLIAHGSSFSISRVVTTTGAATTFIRQQELIPGINIPYQLMLAAVIFLMAGMLRRELAGKREMKTRVPDLIIFGVTYTFVHLLGALRDPIETFVGDWTTAAIGIEVGPQMITVSGYQLFCSVTIWSSVLALALLFGRTSPIGKRIVKKARG